MFHLNGYHGTRDVAVTLFFIGLILGCSQAGDADSRPTSASATTSARQTQSSVENPSATTVYGQVEGVDNNSILTFKGIRYGANTFNTRFSAPAKPEPWQGIENAKAFGASCPQTPTGNPGGLFSSWRPQPNPPLSEDCLFLNVWTPSLTNDAARPVLVWFHGGGFSSGSGSSNAYDGVRLAKRGDVVVVTVNHRLNVFGYLALAHYGEEFQDSAAAGALDMVQALEWVRDNISNFGGDPNTVMIFGESGGGAKVSTLMALPAAQGLFHRAVVQSGAMLRFPQQETARAAADRVIHNLGLDSQSVAQIKTLPEDVIRKAYAGTGAATAPTIDGRTFTRHPFEPDAAPSGKSVPLMLGTNRTENSLFMGAADPTIFELTWDGLKTALQSAYPDRDVKVVIDGYRKLQPTSTPTDIYFEATTDARWMAGHVTQAGA